MKYIFVGNVVPDDIYYKISKESPASNNVQLSFLRILSNRMGEKCKVISMCRNIELIERRKTKIIWHGQVVEDDCAVYFLVGVICNRLFRRLSEIISASVTLRKEVKKYHNINEDVTIVLANGYTQYWIPSIISKKKNDKVISIFQEGVDVSKFSKLSDTFLNRLRGKLNTKHMKKYDGIISFCKNEPTENTSDFTKKLFLIHSHDAEEFDNLKKIRSKSEKTIVCTSSLTDIYGHDVLIDAFKKLPRFFRLELCGGGGGTAEKLVKKAAESDERISWHGLLSKSDCLKLEKSADILIMLRKSHNIYDLYNAVNMQPSKLGEYLLSGVPIVCNDIPSIPEEMKEYLNLCCLSSDAIAEKIMEIDKNMNEAIEKANAGRDWGKKFCSTEMQEHLVSDFLDCFQ